MKVPQDFAARLFLFLACLPSGSAVLAEVYGVASLHDVVWYAAVPGYLTLIGAWFYARRIRNASLADALLIGSLGGFLGTIGYDVARIPFVLAGQNVYMPNSTYGLWILNAAASSRFTETVGWSYHFANGITFGIMYALFMRGRHWAFGVVWAFVLETIALLSPYGSIYHLAGSPLRIGIAYYGHVGYGLPLGLMVARWGATSRILRSLPTVVRLVAIVIPLAAVTGSLTSVSAQLVDAGAENGRFVVEDARLTPGFLRPLGPREVALQNTCNAHSEIVMDATQNISLAPCQRLRLTNLQPGIHQLFVRSSNYRSHSSYILVDPVAAAR